MQASIIIYDRKTKYINHDRLFKELIKTFFKEFVEVFFPGIISTSTFHL